jgi:hypothetical protein
MMARPRVGLLGLTLELYETLAPDLRPGREEWVRRAVLPALGQGGAGFITVGARSTELTVFYNGALRYSRQIDVGLLDVVSHQAALTAAYLRGQVCTQAGQSAPPSVAGQDAKSMCDQILSDFVNSDAYSQDVRQRADLEANDCYLDVARISGDVSVCDSIVAWGNVVTPLSGAATSRALCVQEANQSAQMCTSNYFQTHQDSLCNALFILPLVLVGAIVAGRRR